MGKKAVIIIRLVPEAEVTDDKEIARQIRKERNIPFCAKVEKVSINSDKTAKAVIDWYTK
jgi:flagellar basal body P-ring protein FlgI